MRAIRALTATLALLLVAIPAGGVASAEDGTATLTLTAGSWSAPIEEARLVLEASGPVTLSGPPGTTGDLPAGTYGLSLPGGSFQWFDDGQIGYQLTEITCSNAPSGVSEVTLVPGEVVVCTFEMVLVVPSQPVRPPVVAPPQVPAVAVPPPGSSEPAAELPFTGPETTVPAVAGLALVLLGTSLVMWSRRSARQWSPAPGARTPDL